MKIRTFFLFLLVFSLLLPFSALADEREEPIDVIIALDKSLSMIPMLQIKLICPHHHVMVSEFL